MKKFNWLSLRPATIRNTFNLKMGAFALLLAAGLSSCEEHNCEPATACNKPATACNTFATVEDDGCRPGYLGGKWLRLDNGNLLMPQASSVSIPNLVHGQRVMIGFVTLQTNPQPTYICNYVQAPEDPDQAIQITCIEPIGFCGTPPNGFNCNVYVTAENVMCGSGVWQNTWLRTDNGTLLQPWETLVNFQQLEAGKRYRIGFEKVTRDNRYDNQVMCQAVPPPAEAVRITCLEPEAATE